jgi:hypothetical protein
LSFCCNPQVDNRGIEITLKTVVSNYPVSKIVDTELLPLPEIVFVFSFRNTSKEDQFLVFENNNNGSNFKVGLLCLNNTISIIPLFKNTNREAFLKRGSELMLSFRARTSDLVAALNSCEGDSYLGVKLERMTKRIHVYYNSSAGVIQGECVRENFLGPDYPLTD